VQLCCRYERLPARRLVDLVRAAWVAVWLSGVTALAEWTAVALGLHRAEWTAATAWQVAALAVLSAAIILCGVLLDRARRALARYAGAGAQPDWLTDRCSCACGRAGGSARCRPRPGRLSAGSTAS
jgi:hypothetical protein